MSNYGRKPAPRGMIYVLGGLIIGILALSIVVMILLISKLAGGKKTDETSSNKTEISSIVVEDSKGKNQESSKEDSKEDSKKQESSREEESYYEEEEESSEEESSEEESSEESYVRPEPPEGSNSGSFESATGTDLNLVVDWYAYTEDGQRKASLEILVESYGVDCSGRYDGLAISVGGETYYYDSEGISYDGSNGLETVSMRTITVNIPSDGANVSVSWAFRGNYSGVELENITASGYVY